MEYVSSCSPILILRNNKVIGIHNSDKKYSQFNYNLGIFIKYPLKEFIERNKKVNKYPNIKNRNLSMDKTGTINQVKKMKLINQNIKNKIKNNKNNNNNKININTFCYNKQLNETNNINNMKSIEIVQLLSIYDLNNKN